jgi:hypothetical protein
MNITDSTLPNPVIPPDMPTSEILARTAPMTPQPRSASIISFLRSRWMPLTGGLLGMGALGAVALTLWKKSPPTTLWGQLKAAMT